MAVTRIDKDPAAMTMVVAAEFDAPVERIWEMWSNPRLLEKWWGPPTYPATVVEHDFNVGGAVSYFMTGPEGDRHHGWWRIRSIEAPHRLELEDGFADDDGTPDQSMPKVITRVEIRAITPDRSAMTIETVFPSAEAMEQMIEMGMEEGISAAIGQIDGLLEAPGR